MKSMFAVVFGAAVANASLNNRFANGTTTVGPTATGGVVYTTEVVDVYTTYCPEAGLVHVQNKTYTITTPTMLTITDCPCTIHKPVHTNTPVPDECAQRCMAEYRKCQTTPDANFSSCAAKLAACVNYNPFGETFVPPVACSAQGGAPTGTSPAIGTAPGGGATPEPTQPSGPAGSTGPSSTPNPTAGAGQLTPALALLALGAAVLL